MSKEFIRHVDFINDLVLQVCMSLSSSRQKCLKDQYRLSMSSTEDEMVTTVGIGGEPLNLTPCQSTDNFEFVGSGFMYETPYRESENRPFEDQIPSG